LIVADTVAVCAYSDAAAKRKRQNLFMNIVLRDNGARDTVFLAR
jgi:hypothetical protein